MNTPRLTLQRFRIFPQVNWVEGVFDRAIPFVQQPDQVAVGLYGPLARQGLANNSSLALADEAHAFAPALPEHLGDSWEVLGSDYNSGMAWFGPADAVEAVIERVRAMVFERLEALAVMPVNDDGFAIPHWRSWAFEDGTRLLLVYIDADDPGFHLQTVTAEGVAQALFGAHTDDLLLHEFLGAVARPLLAQAGFPVPVIQDGEDHDEGDDESLDEALEAFSVAGREARASDARLLLDFTRHVLVDLMGWEQAPIGKVRGDGDDEEDTSDLDDDPNDRALAQTVQRWHEQGGVSPALVRLVSPTGEAVAVELLEIPNLDRYRGMRFHRELVWLSEGMFVVRLHRAEEDGQLVAVRESLPTSKEAATLAHATTVQDHLDRGYSKQV